MYEIRAFRYVWPKRKERSDAERAEPKAEKADKDDRLNSVNGQNQKRANYDSWAGKPLGPDRGDAPRAPLAKAKTTAMSRAGQGRP